MEQSTQMTTLRNFLLITNETFMYYCGQTPSLNGIWEQSKEQWLWEGTVEDRQAIN
jgi:hypothetical protein